MLKAHLLACMSAVGVTFVSAGPAQAVVARLNQEVRRYLQSAEAKDVFLKMSVETAPGSPEELTAFMKSDIARTDKVLKAAGGGAQ
jgi:tripartite-type tricarboxylate transporter receptor subunit TctC